MTFFKDRHNLRDDYSGYQEVSASLRKKIIAIIDNYATSKTVFGTYSVDKPNCFDLENLEYKALIIDGSSNVHKIINEGKFYEVFQVIEIFFDLAELEINNDSCKRALLEMMQAFHYSGSVYKITNEGNVELKTDKELSKKIEEAKKTLEENTDTYDLFMNSVSKFLKREDAPSQLIGNLYIAAEKFLIAKTGKTGKKALSNSIKKLKEEGIIAGVQKDAFLTEIEGYASGTPEIRHGGGEKITKPDEADALWYLGIFSTYIMLIDRKLKQKKNV